MKEVFFDCLTSGACLLAHDEATVKDYIWSPEPNKIVKLCQFQIDNAHLWGWAGSGFTLTLAKDNDIIPQSYSTRIERPCRNCNRPNDIGVKSCWLCECSNPT